MIKTYLMLCDLRVYGIRTVSRWELIGAFIAQLHFIQQLQQL